MDLGRAAVSISGSPAGAPLSQQRATAPAARCPAGCSARHSAEWVAVWQDIQVAVTSNGSPRSTKTAPVASNRHILAIFPSFLAVPADTILPRLLIIWNSHANMSSILHIRPNPASCIFASRAMTCRMSSRSATREGTVNQRQDRWYCTADARGGRIFP